MLDGTALLQRIIVQRVKSGVGTAYGIPLQTRIVQLVVAGRLDQCVLDDWLAHVVIQLALFAVMVSNVAAAARLLSLDEHVTHSRGLKADQRSGQFPSLSIPFQLLSVLVF